LTGNGAERRLWAGSGNPKIFFTQDGITPRVTP
jgi:hypothetical protein